VKVTPAWTRGRSSAASSWGGPQVINTSRKFTGVDKRFYGYRLDEEIKVNRW
jgi:hypothetical protein